MVLLRGLNYDYAGQETTILKKSVENAKTTITVENTSGLADDDYLIIAPGTELAEIVQIDATVSSNTQLTISALKFNHSIGATIYRSNFNQMKFYECSTASGTFTLCASGTVDMNFTNEYTNFDFTGATVAYYYKRTFYNEETTVESAIADASYWQTDDEELYVTTEEMRTYMQFDENDFPAPRDYKFFIKLAQINVELDMDSTSSNILFIATLLQTKVEIMRALASKALAKGYSQINAEGRTITKAYQELRLEAENAIQEYKAFIMKNNRREATSTNFMDDTTIVDTWTRKDIIEMMNGTTDAIDFQSYYSFRRR